MNIQFVRLDDDLCVTLNRLAEEHGRKVSDLVNEILRGELKKRAAGASSGEAAAK